MKNTATTPTKIQEIQAQVGTLNAEIVTYQEEILKFEESIVMIQNFPGWQPQESTGIFEMLRDIIATEPAAEQRAKRLQQAKDALQEAKKLLAQKQNTAEMLGQLLIAEESEAEWQRRFAPFVKEYESGFLVPSDPNAVRIAQAEKELADDRASLEKARVWLTTPENRRPRYSLSFASIDPQGDFNYLSAKIPESEKRLQKLKEIPPVPRNEEDFRKYIRGRVTIQKSLERLLQAQSEYLQALQEFKEAATGQESAFNFSLKNLAELPQVVAIANNKIILVKGGKNG